MVGVGLMMGGLSLGELKGAIASRPSKNTDDSNDDDDEAREDRLRKMGVRVVPASSTPVPPGSTAGGKPAWMLELEAKKRAKAASERRIG